MTELKTMKDLKIKYSGTDNLKFVQGQSNALKQCKEELKTEAVKWVKKLQQMIKDEVYNTEKLNSNLDIFMEFFNLTEKEIQDA